MKLAKTYQNKAYNLSTEKFNVKTPFYQLDIENDNQPIFFFLFHPIQNRNRNNISVFLFMSFFFLMQIN